MFIVIPSTILHQLKWEQIMNKLTNIKHYRKEYVRAAYGRYGKESGINPGAMWPRKEELTYLKQYEKAFCHRLEDLVAENKAKKEQAIRERREREEEVYRNMQKLPAAFASFIEKVEQKQKEKEEWTKQREALIEEVREILGFRAKPDDERFQQALAKKEEEDLKAKKKEARKKRENASLDELLATVKGEKENKE